MNLAELISKHLRRMNNIRCECFLNTCRFYCKGKISRRYIGDIYTKRATASVYVYVGDCEQATIDFHNPKAFDMLDKVIGDACDLVNS